VFFYFILILGASSDFDNATKIAKRMVTKFGMSEKVIVDFIVRSFLEL
jgi:ATP-dependent Zn protease